MANMEPRLSYLLNESKTPQSSHDDLPPLNASPLFSHGNGTAPPLDRDANQRSYSTGTPHSSDRDGRHIGSLSAYPIRTLLGDNDKHKATQQFFTIPPIINDLQEPPPDTALASPISSGSRDKTESRHVYNNGNKYHLIRQSTPGYRRISTERHQQATRLKRKWSDEETLQLLLAVNRHGLSQWASIIKDPEFPFKDYTAREIREKFYRCCPAELRSSDKSSSHNSEDKHSSNKALHTENISTNNESPKSETLKHQSENPKKNQAHFKNLEDLAKLGIRGPFKQSNRRKSRLFTEQEDREILEGLEQYGTAWTTIQRDSKFHLSSRQPIDLRNRVRKRYPVIYKQLVTKQDSGPAFVQ